MADPQEEPHPALDAAYAAARERVAEEDKRRQEELDAKKAKEREERQREEEEWLDHVKDAKPKTVWLVAIDGSDEAMLGARRCFELAGTDDGIYLLHIIEKKGHLKQESHESTETWGIRTKEYYEAAEFEGKLQLKRAQELEQKLRAEKEIAQGKGKGDGKTLRRLFVTASIVTANDAREEICNQATELGAHILVVGSKGKGRMERALLGSVSTYVILKLLQKFLIESSLITAILSIILLCRLL